MEKPKLKTKLDRWEEFEGSLRELNKCRSRLLEDSAEVSKILFRGQSDSEQLLESTLDRFFSKQVSLLEYYKIIAEVKPKIETFADRQWTIPTYAEYEEYVNNLDHQFFEEIGPKEYMEYMAYLRHHGFPSPLLDWTESPYIAAFFAFKNKPRPKTQEVQYVSIFAYLAWVRGSRSASTGKPDIHCLRSGNARLPKRHFLQQSQYTVCTNKVNAPRSNLNYARHQDVVDRNERNEDLLDQDWLWKFDIPVTERHKVLSWLNTVNIDAFSLFGSEDSLIETIATTDIFLKGRDHD